MEILKYNYCGLCKVPGCDLGAELIARQCLNMGYKVATLEQTVDVKTGSYLGQNKVTIVLGADHSSTALFIENYIKNDLDVLIIFDAHNDYNTLYKQSDPYTNWNVINKVESYFSNIIVVGSRYKHKNMAECLSVHYVKPYLIHRFDYKKYVLNKNIYVSVDLDVFDPSIFKAVFHPVQGGLFLNEFLILLQQLILHSKSIIIDIVEFNPIVERNNALEFIMAIIQEIVDIENGEYKVV